MPDIDAPEPPQPPKTAKRTGKSYSLASELALMFLPLLVGAVGSANWLSNMAAQSSIEDAATALVRSTDDRIRERVTSFLAEPERVTRINLSEIELGLLDPTDLQQMERRIARQVIDFGSVAYIYYGTEQGEAIGFQREAEGGFSYSKRDEHGNFATFDANPDLSLGALLDPGSPYDPRTRTWYKAGAVSREPTWADVYVWFGRDELCVDVVAAVVGPSDEVVGVLDAGYTLGQLSTFLQGLEIGRTGAAFIVDEAGLLVASSAGQSLTITDGVAERIGPQELDDPLSSFVGAALPTLGAAPSFTFLEHPTLGRLTVGVWPLEIHDSLRWTLAVAVPQSDFTAHYDALRSQTLVLTILSVLFTIIAALLFVRRLASPLELLAEAAEQIRRGDLNVVLPPATGDEIGQLTIAMGDMVQGLQERETIRQAFGRYVTEEVAEQVLADPDAMRLGGVRRRVTILMSDLRGFTARSNQLEPETLIALLNEYLGEMTTAILAHEGLIVEFIGDAILVLFGATGDREDDAVRAARCALEMHERLDALNVVLLERGVPVLQMGIGVHTGEVIVGNIGSSHRVKFGVVGDAVNTTARVEALTIGGQVLVSGTTAADLGEELRLGPRASTHVKGLSEPLIIQELLRERARSDLTLPPYVAPEVSADLYTVANKTLSEAAIPVILGAQRGDRLSVRSPRPLSVFDDVVIVVVAGDPTDASARLYCKVMEHTAEAEHVHHLTVVITAVAEE